MPCPQAVCTKSVRSKCPAGARISRQKLVRYADRTAPASGVSWSRLWRSPADRWHRPSGFHLPAHRVRQWFAAAACNPERPNLDCELVLRRAHA